MKYKVKVINIKSRLHIRKGAGTTYSVIGHRKNGDTFIVTKQKKLSNGEVWYKQSGANKWSCAKTKSGKKYLKVIQDLEKSSGSKKPSGTIVGTLTGMPKPVQPPKTPPKKTSNVIQDVKANIGKGVPKEPTSAAANPVRFSRSETKSDKLVKGDSIELVNNGDIAGVYNPYGFIMYTSSNFPKIESKRSRDTRTYDLNGWSNKSICNLINTDIHHNLKSDNGGWIFTGVKNGRGQLVKPKDITSIDYTLDPLNQGIDKDDYNAIKRNINLPVCTPRSLLNKRTHLDFNRFKIQYPDELLRNAYGVMFFTRPDLNIMDDDKSADDKVTWYIRHQVKRNLRDFYILLQNPAIGGLLTQRGGNISALKNHNFNPLLSNQAQGIEVVDDSVDLLEYGETFTGYKMHYSKSITKSTAAGTLNIKFKETYDLAITNLHQIWVDYQSNVYKGIFKPKPNHIWAKELDYACNIYYFLLDQDMETILFWTKYYGCFPSNVPKSTFSFDFGSNVQFPDVTVTYNYIYKSDLSPQTLVEFNQDGGAGKLPFVYTPIGVKSGEGIDTSSWSWVGVPYVATYRDTENEDLLKYMYHKDMKKSDKLKLRWRKYGDYSGTKAQSRQSMAESAADAERYLK